MHEAPRPKVGGRGVSCVRHPRPSYRTVRLAQAAKGCEIRCNDGADPLGISAWGYADRDHTWSAPPMLPAPLGAGTRGTGSAPAKVRRRPYSAGHQSGGAVRTTGI